MCPIALWDGRFSETILDPVSNTTGSFSNDDGDGNDNVKKETCFLRKTTTLQVHNALLYIFSPSLHDYEVKMPSFTFLGERIKTNDDEFFLSLSKIQCGPHEIHSRGIRLHLTFSAHWNKRDKACKKRFSLPSPSSLLKLPNKIQGPVSRKSR